MGYFERNLFSDISLGWLSSKINSTEIYFPIIKPTIKSVIAIVMNTLHYYFKPVAEVVVKRQDKQMSDPNRYPLITGLIKKTLFYVTTNASIGHMENLFSNQFKCTKLNSSKLILAVLVRNFLLRK